MEFFKELISTMPEPIRFALYIAAAFLISAIMAAIFGGKRR